MRKAEALISRGALRHNMGVLQRIVGPGVQLWPAVKANAYGHGCGSCTQHDTTKLMTPLSTERALWRGSFSTSATGPCAWLT
jgi:hypothetical protein